MKEVRVSAANQVKMANTGAAAGMPAQHRHDFEGRARMDSVRFAVIGCGNISQAHVHAIQRTEGASLAAVVDIAEPRAREVANRTGCRWYTSLEALLNDSITIDAVSICTASGLHMEPAMQAASAGKHVLVEKPLETTVERCNAIIRACEENNVLLGGVFQSRFFPGNLLVKRAAASGAFGRLLLGEAAVKWFRPKNYFTSAGWRGTWRFDGGGALMNQGIHQVDLLQWIMGPVASVHATTRRMVHESIEVEDLAVALLQFTNGAVGVVEASTAIMPGYPKRLEIHGSDGGAIVEDDIILQSTGITEGPELLSAQQKQVQTSTFSDPMAMSFAGHERQVADFVQAIRSGGTPIVTGREARKAVEIVTAVYESARTGKTVELNTGSH
ncbi:MAG: Gfo/Idh/MocA family protein [Limnochordia bacterium]